MNKMNINDIGVVALSRSEEYEIAGGWDWSDFCGATLIGAGSGALAGSMAGGVGAAPGALGGGLFGAWTYTSCQLWDHFFGE